MATQNSTAAASTNPYVNGLKILSEGWLTPGGSLLLDGNLLGAGAHALGGLVAKSLFGPIGWLLVAANSYSNSVTGKHLHQHLKR